MRRDRPTWPNAPHLERFDVRAGGRVTGICCSTIYIRVRP